MGKIGPLKALLTVLFLAFNCSNFDDPSNQKSGNTGVENKKDEDGEESECGKETYFFLTKEKKKDCYYKKFNVLCVDKLVHHDGEVVSPFLPEKSFGPPEGGGRWEGSLDVFSVGRGKTAVFEVEGRSFTDNPGVDLKVFENPFEIINGNGSIYSESGTFEISPNLENWYGFPIFGSEIDCNSDLCNKYEIEGLRLAGLNTVQTNYVSNFVDPREDEAGGDGFDFSDARKILRREGSTPKNFIYESSPEENLEVRFFKITDNGDDSGVDIDAICIFL